MCFSTAKWKREEVQDHKFDFVDVSDFYESSILRKFKYSILFMVVLKSILVYMADMWTAGILLIFDRWSSAIQPKIPFFISKWIYVGCIFFSFLLLAWDIKKARHIIATRDISYAFTSTIAYRYYTLRSYKHYCFFSQINNSKKKADEVAFFVFFTFKGWKRLIFAEAPRQMINAVTLYSVLQSTKQKKLFHINSYGDGMIQRMTLGFMAFTLLVFFLSFTMLLIAFLMYIPLLCQIRGNLKEYCCHKIDKRLSELLKKKSQKRVQQRQQEASAEAKGDFSHLKNKKGELRTFRQPKLPVFQDDDTLPLPPYGQVAYVNMPDNMSLPPYGSRSNTPGPTRTGTPVSRTGTPGPRVGTPVLRNGGPRPGVPGYGPPPGGQRGPFMSRRNSNSSIRSDMTGISAYSGTTTYTLTGPGYPVPSRFHTPIPRAYTPTIAPAIVATMQDQQNDTDDPYGGALDDYDFDHEERSQVSHEFNTVINNFRNDFNPNDVSQPITDVRHMPPPAVHQPYMRSSSPTPSISSTTSSRPRPQPPNASGNITVPSRYYHQPEQRGLRQNNYAQQGGGQTKSDQIY
ncbi:10947_t:CDS:2 [Acaulospora morrowiae]|uniref:10947_t:CDS:1 n=1 Tax=Acaulospora morrowiae TaxID=94023 RepID=A0A9N9FXM0_9GLOM|nr:10947_t:CDS:2 [Acaulospora morrowiae]